MNGLTKKDLQRRDNHLERIEAAVREAARIAREYNTILAAKGEELQNAIGAANIEIEEAAEWMQTVFERAKAFLRTRTESWKDSDRGDKFEGWMDDFRPDNLDRLPLPDFDEAEVPNEVYTQWLRDLQQKPT